MSRSINLLGHPTRRSVESMVITGRTRRVRFRCPAFSPTAVVLSVVWALLWALCPAAFAQTMPQTSIVRKLQGPTERMEMIINTSRILTLDQKIPKVQVNNPEILQLVPLSPTEVQISAKKPGVTQINLWTEDKEIHTVDVMVIGDARELSEMLKIALPHASLKVMPIGSGVRISGFVDKPQDVSQVIRIAEEYYPKVINAIRVGGEQQVLLHVKVMEVSRTKLRELGFDWASIGNSGMVTSGAAGLIPPDVNNTVLTNLLGKMPTASNFTFQVFGGSDFFGILKALREDKLLKILAEPTLVTISGRPAYFQVGGSVPVLVPQSLGTVSVEYKNYGTQVDFVPIVLGDGNIHLDVRPKVSEIDPNRTTDFQGYTLYAFNVREVETGVEMKAGQTLAIAGLVQNRIESQRSGLPWISEIPFFGVPFRKVKNENNEIELLILVTPELVDPLNPEQVPPCGPGMGTTEPNDCELYLKGFPEVPRCCEPFGGDGVQGGPCPQAVPNGGAFPEMILEPQPEPAGMIDLQSSTRREPTVRPMMVPQMGRVNPAYRQNPRTSQNPTTENDLPGFKGPVGYEMLR